MLGKLIKYDFMFGAKQYLFMGALTLVLMIMTIFGSIFKSSIVLGFFMFFSIVATIGFVIMYYVITVRHLHSQLCGRESYLSYILPVSPQAIVLSKLISIFIWGIFTVLILVLFWTVAVERVVFIQQGISFIETIKQEAIRFNENNQIVQFSDMFASGILYIALSGLLGTTMIIYFSSVANIPFLKVRNFGIGGAVLGYILTNSFIGLIPMGILYTVIKIRSTEAFDVIGNGQMEAYMLSSFNIVFSTFSLLAAALFFYLTVVNIKHHKSI